MNMTRPIVSLVRPVLALTLAALVLSGCGSFRRAVGWDKSIPDEFAVMTYPPLAQPPDFDLRPPNPNLGNSQAVTPRDQAMNLMGGRPGGASGAAAANASSAPGTVLAPLVAAPTAAPDLSGGEQALLKKAGADNAPSDIREKVQSDSTALVDTNRSFVDSVMFWRRAPASAPPADPRLAGEQQEAMLGQIPGAEGSPQITRAKKGFLGSIF